MNGVNYDKARLEKPLSYWNIVLYADGSKFNRFGSDKRPYVRRNMKTVFDSRYITKNH